MVRGGVELSDVRRNIDRHVQTIVLRCDRHRLRKTLRFVPWNQEGWKTGLCSVPPVGQVRTISQASDNIGIDAC